MKMGDCYDEYLLWIDAIDQAIRKAPQEIASVCAFVDRPQLGKLLNPLQPSLNFIEEPVSKTSLLSRVGGGCGAHLLGSIRVEGYVRHRRCSRASRSTWSAGLVTEAPALIS
jgi:hypothetical protein